MSTLAAVGPAVHHDAPVMVGLVVVVLLLGIALNQVGRAIAPIGELVRMVLSALAVAALLILAIAVLIVLLMTRT